MIRLTAIMLACLSMAFTATAEARGAQAGTFEPSVINPVAPGSIGRSVVRRARSTVVDSRQRRVTHGTLAVARDTAVKPELAKTAPLGRPDPPPSGVHASGQVLAHPAGCPGRLYCGCGVCVRVFGHPCPVGGLAMADEWRRRYQQVAAAAHTVAVWMHGRYAYHVSYVEDRRGDEVLLYDPNSTRGLTWLHWRKMIAGMIFVRPTE
jgi:hypothetical protein